MNQITTLTGKSPHKGDLPIRVERTTQRTQRWRTFSLASLFAVLMAILPSIEAFSQIPSTTYNFNANSTGWTGNITRTTATTACGSASMRRNLYGSVTTGNMVSPGLAGNNTGPVTVSYNYKAANWPGNTVGTNPWGSFNVQYGFSATGPWTTFATVNQETQTGTCIAKTHTFTPPAGTTLYIKWDCFWTNGDYYINFDDVVISQGVVPPPCSGTPTPGNTISNVPSVCAGSTVDLSLQNSTAGTGVTYQWQSSSDNITYNNIPGATSLTYTATLAASTWYRCNVTCSGNTGTSNPVQVTTTIFSSCYCSTSASSAIDTEILNVTLGALNNTSNCSVAATGPGSILNRYANYSNLTPVTIDKIIPVSFSVTPGTCGGEYTKGFRIFIDGNQDGDFNDAGEAVYTSAAVNTSAPVSGTINIPGTFLDGLTGMRVVLYETATPATISPCVGLTYGEVEDYIINLNTPPVCSATPPASNTLSTFTSVCAGANYTLSLSNSYSLAGYTFQWQSSPDNVTYTDIVGATLATLTTNQTAATYYRCRINCTFGGIQTISTPLQINMAPFYNCYCTSAATSTADEDIVNVSVGTLNNTSACNTVAPGAGSVASLYSNFTGVAPPSLNLSQTYALSVGVRGCGGTGYTSSVRVFIDYNQDGDYSDAGETVATIGPLTSGVGVGTPFNANINIPCTATTGLTGMRVVAVETGTPTSINPCGTFTWGETEDYVVNISNAAACSGTPASSNALSSVASTCPATPFNLSLDASYASCDFTFQWERSTDGGVTFSTIVGATTANYTVPNQTAASQYQCIITCTNGGATVTSAPVSVGQNTLFACYCPSSANNTADGEIVGVSVGTISQASTCATTAPGAGSILQRYSNYTAVQTDLTKTVTNAMSVNIQGCGAIGYDYITKVWIDYNQSGSFEAGELIYTSPITTATTAAPASLNFTFAVPLSAVDGVTMMRVVTWETTVAADVVACGTYGWGETEDYSVNIITPPTCSGVPAAGTLPASLQILNNTSTTLTPLGAEVALGITYAWEESDDNGGADPWGPVVGGSGATLVNYTTPNLTTTRWYRLVTTCTEPGGGTATSNAIQITTVGGASCADPYVVSSLPFTLNFSSNGAGNDIGVQTSSCSNLYGGGQDVVFQFTAPSAGNYEISVVNTSNTRFIGWFLKSGTDCALTTLASQVGCAVSTGTYNSAHNVVSIPSAGTYYVIVDYASPVTQSNFFIRIRQTPAAPANDNCASASVLIQGGATCSSPVAGTTAGATSSGIAVACSGGNADDDVWYSFVATSDAVVVELSASTNGVVQSGSNLAWELFPATCGDPALFCNNLSANRGVAETNTVVGLTIGTTYRIRVYDMDAGYGSASGNFSICLTTPPPPANNDCGGATVLAVGASCVTTAGNTVAATQSLPASACSGFTGNADDDVWYTFTLAAATNVNIEVAATNTVMDPVVQLYSGSCGSPTSLFCSDNSLQGGVERITRVLPAGTYFVRVYHYGVGTGAGGSHTICVTNSFPATAPANDNTCQAVDLPVGNACSPEGPYSSNTATRSLNLPLAQQGDGTPNDDVWFKFTTDASQTTVSINVQGGGGYDAVFQVYTMTNCKTLTGLFAPIDLTGANGIETQTIFGLTGNTTYYIRVFDWFGTAPAGNFTICTFVTPPPPNDLFVNATQLYQQNSATCFGATDGYTVNATAGDAAAPGSCGGTADDNVWYTFIATAPTATITVTGSQGFDPTVDFRSGAGVGTSVICADATGVDGTETINATGLTPGQSYKIQVFGAGANPTGWGTFSICVFGLATPPANDNCAGAFALPNASPCSPVSGVLTGATQTLPSNCSFNSPTYDVWYSFIASSPQATLTPVGALGATDMVVEMYSGSCGALTSIGCADNDPAPGTENLVVNGLTPGVVYYARVYASSSIAPGTSTGVNPNFTLCYTGVPPANDEITGATLVNVSSNRADILTNNLGATNTALSPGAYFTDWNNDVWFRCVVPTNGVVAINCLPIGFNDSKIRVFTSSDNTATGTLTNIAWDDDGGAGFGSFVYMSGLTPGNTLFFAIDGFSAANFGQFRINVNDGWLWTGANGFGYNSAGNWINQGAADATPNPFATVTNSFSTGWGVAAGNAVINIPPVTNQPIVTANTSIGGIKFVGGVFTQSRITVNTGVILTLNGATFAGSGRGITGVAAGGRVEGAGRLDIGSSLSQDVSIAYPTRFRCATTVLGTTNVNSNGNMIFDNGASLYSGLTGPAFSMVNGNITYRRQGNTSQYVYNFWGAPISNATLASLSAPGLIPNLYAYNTANATGLDYLGTQAGWQPLTPGTAMQPSKGYIATGAGLANFTGLPNQIAVSYTPQSGAGGNDFNLLANPYPAPLGASNFLTANAARIVGGAMYLWDDDASGGTDYSAGDFIVYTGLGTVNGPNSGSPFSGNIGSCQGFFVNYNTAGGGTFNFTNAMKVYGTNSEFFDATNITRMRLRMENVNAVASEAIVAFLEDATDAADSQYDALRLAGNTQMSLYTFNGNLEYAVQAWPTLTNERVIDLGTVNTVAGPSTISMNLFENFDPSVIVYLEDTELGVFHNLTADNIYQFNNTGLNGEAVRFRLHFRAPIAVASSMDCSGTESGKIIVANPNATPVALEVKNANNEVVATAAAFVGEHEVTNLSAGNYSLKLTYTDGGSTTKNAVVESNGMTAPASFIASATTVSIADAIIEFQGTAQGASEYIWDFGDGTIVTGDLNPVHAYTSLGVYTVTFTALNNGCGSTATSTVSVTNDATGIGSATTSNGFSIFPNPATDVANLLLNVDRSENEVTISINDAAGRLVSTKLVNDVRSGAVIGLDINGLANGVYQVSVEGKNFRNVGRLTIAK